ncbi:collagen adhesin domain protein, partial [Fusobacterium sp. CM21]
LKVTYKAELKEEWKDGKPYPLSQTAKLNLKAVTEADNRVVNFDIPTVKDEKIVDLKVNKTWEGKVPASVANGITFDVNPSPDGKQLKVTVNPNNWSGELKGVPKYKDGKEITYTISEPVSSDYKVISPKPANGQLSGTKDNAGDWTFDIRNKNTEKTSLVVTKNWVTADGKEAPADLKFAAKVQLYNGTTKVGNPVAFDNGKAEFTGLDKYNTDGYPIQYTVKEVNEKGEEESNNKITNGKFNYDVTYSYYYSNDSAVVTNKVTNPGAQTFDINLKKTWKGGVGNEAEFVFTNS